MNVLKSARDTGVSESFIRDCECWKHNVSLVIVAEGLPKEAIRHLYCPSCSQGIRKDETCMVESKGWLIHYDPEWLGPPDAMVCLAHDLQEEGCILIYMERK
jgi:hypothetical protein